MLARLALAHTSARRRGGRRILFLSTRLAGFTPAASFMTDLASLHKTARSLVLGLREGLERLEKAENVRQKTHPNGGGWRAPGAPPRLSHNASLIHTGRPADGRRQPSPRPAAPPGRPGPRQPAAGRRVADALGAGGVGERAGRLETVRRETEREREAYSVRVCGRGGWAPQVRACVEGATPLGEAEVETPGALSHLFSPTIEHGQ